MSVKSAIKINNFFHAIVGQAGIIVEKKHLSVNSNSFNFEVTVDQAMLPTSDLIVYFIKSSGEMVSNQVQLRHDQDATDQQLFVNHVS